MASFFRVRQVQANPPCTRAYLIESTAHINVEDADAIASAPLVPGALNPSTVGTTKLLETELLELDADTAIEDMANYLTDEDGASPEIVITVHGFNNPEAVVLNRYEKAFQFVNSDATICNRTDLICIGYRWPSEKMGAPAATFRTGAPYFLFYFLYAGLILLVFQSLFRGLSGMAFPVVLPLAQFLVWLVCLPLGVLLVALPCVVFLLRAVVYFRDGYRAAQYGTPDLLEVIRQLDKALAAKGRRNRVKLSFIAHSMGAYVVTGLVRILSDVFDTHSMRDLRQGTTGDTLDPNIGNALQLGRLVLVSPDIPAETLMTRRANFLAPSLVRFEEAYLFGNAGDVVLRLISTLANSFSFPTGERRFGYRLGNAEIVSDDYGVVDGNAFESVRVGARTLEELGDALPQGTTERTVTLPERFTYIDCTDYIDAQKDASGKPTGKTVGYLTFAKRLPIIGEGERWRLLMAYLRGKVDVHSGYFDGDTTQKMIYRLACLGWGGMLDATATEAALGTTSAAAADPAPNRLARFNQLCRDKGIQVLRSPFLPNGGE